VGGFVLGKVFCFVVCASELAGLGSGSGDKIRLPEFGTVLGKEILNLLEVFFVVGCNLDSAFGFEGSQELIEIVSLEEAPFVVAFFWPGVREVDVEAVDGGIGDVVLDE